VKSRALQPVVCHHRQVPYDQSGRHDKTEAGWLAILNRSPNVGADAHQLQERTVNDHQPVPAAQQPRMRAATRIAAVAALLAAMSGAARAETTICTEITSVPFSITMPGNYCLKTSFSTAAGTAISVSASDVAIDFNGNLIDGTPAGSGAMNRGVSAFNQKNVVVRNGTLRGFFLGVDLNGATPSSAESYVVERMRVERGTWEGINVVGRASIVRHNVVLSTTGTTIPGFGGAAIGIRAFGDLAQITDNQVLDTVEQPGGTAYGILIPGAGTTSGTIERNVISNAVLGPTQSIGIAVFQSRHTVVANHVVKMRIGLQLGDATSLYKDNTVGGATIPFINGTAAGATNFSF
jgi:hypothetical protein